MIIAGTICKSVPILISSTHSIQVRYYSINMYIQACTALGNSLPWRHSVFVPAQNIASVVFSLLSFSPWQNLDTFTLLGLSNWVCFTASLLYRCLVTTCYREWVPLAHSTSATQHSLIRTAQEVRQFDVCCCCPGLWWDMILTRRIRT